MVKENIEIRREFWQYTVKSVDIELLHRRVKEIVRIIKPNKKIFTHNYLKELLRDNKLSEGYEKYIYMYLMNLKKVEVYNG